MKQICREYIVDMKQMVQKISLFEKNIQYVLNIFKKILTITI